MPVAAALESPSELPELELTELKPLQPVKPAIAVANAIVTLAKKWCAENNFFWSEIIGLVSISIHHHGLDARRGGRESFKSFS